MSHQDYAARAKSRRASAVRQSTQPRHPGLGIQPGYQILFNSLYENIANGTWRPAAQIPSERELCDLYRVSRTMVRQALLNAERRGLVMRVPGKGTFVAHRRIQQDLDHLTSFREALQAHSLEPWSRILRVDWEMASALVARRLDLAAGTRVLAVDILGLAGDRPMALYNSHIVPGVAETVQRALADAKSNEIHSSYEVIAQALNLDVLVADQLFEATAADRAISSQLAVTVGSAVFRVSSIFRTPQAIPVETRVAIYPGDRYVFHAVREFHRSSPR
jgi:GntR family transcriptional regulator